MQNSVLCTQCTEMLGFFSAIQSSESEWSRMVLPDFGESLDGFYIGTGTADDTFELKMASIDTQLCHLCLVLHGQVPLCEETVQSVKGSFATVSLLHEAREDTSWKYMQLRVEIPDEKVSTSHTLIVEWPGISKPTSTLLILNTDNTAVSKLQHEPIKHIPQKSTDSENNWDLARQWTHQCDEYHWCSNSYYDPSRILPTRLISLSSTEFDKPYLCDSDALPLGTKYCTLSHCWGDIPLVSLRKERLGEFHNAIPKESLTKTFQDAIYAAQRLGFQYLWIDSLCIVQDDEHDWMKEAALMSSVYAGSALNLAATASSDGNGGLFHTRDLRSVLPVMTRTVPWSQSSLDHGETIIVNPYLWEEGVENAPLNQRAWVLQERILAPRTLHFGKSQWFWECQQVNAYETFPSGQPPAIQESKGSRLKSLQPRELFWAKSVEFYSKCRLTYEKDKLIAISGIARSLAAESGYVYVAGLWQNDQNYYIISNDDESESRKSKRKWSTFSDSISPETPDLRKPVVDRRSMASGLESHLLWETLHISSKALVGSAYNVSIPDSRRPQIYRAPSWSWASIEGPVSTARWVSEDPFSKVTLKIRVKPETTHSFGWIEDIIHKTLYIHCPSLIMTHISLKDNLTDIKEFGTSRAKALKFNYNIILDVPLDPAEEPFPLQVHLLPVKVTSSKNQEIHEGLVLMATKRTPGEYSRLGIFNVIFSKSAASFDVLPGPDSDDEVEKVGLECLDLTSELDASAYVSLDSSEEEVKRWEDWGMPYMIRLV